MVFKYLNVVSKRWKLTLKNGYYLKRFAICILVLTALVTFFSFYFLEYIDIHNQLQIYDPILSVIPSHDLSIYTFLVLYAAILLSLIYFLAKPYKLLYILEAYILLLILRMTGMYLVPLDLPPHYTTLRDPFLESFVYNQMEKTKDLFFSGHVSMLFLIYYFTSHFKLRRYIMLSGIAVGILILFQHAHYTIDILVAPLAALFCYKLHIYFHNRLPKFSSTY